AKRSHVVRVFGARGEGEEARAAAVAERAVEREGARLAAQLELDVRDGELIVVAGQAADLVDREALAHVPVAVPAIAVPFRPRRRADLQKHLARAQLGGPGAVDARLCLRPA